MQFCAEEIGSSDDRSIESGGRDGGIVKFRPDKRCSGEAVEILVPGKIRLREISESKGGVGQRAIMEISADTSPIEADAGQARAHENGLLRCCNLARSQRRIV